MYMRMHVHCLGQDEAFSCERDPVFVSFSGMAFQTCAGGLTYARMSVRKNIDLFRMRRFPVKVILSLSHSLVAPFKLVLEWSCLYVYACS